MAPPPSPDDPEGVIENRVALGHHPDAALGSLFLGSVPHTAVQHADRPVVIVPSPTVARKCSDRRHSLDEAKVDSTEPKVAAATVKTAEAKALTTEIAILATNKLFELSGTRSTLAQHNLDRHWRNARAHTLHDPVRWKYFHVGNYYLNGVSPPRHPWS